MSQLIGNVISVGRISGKRSYDIIRHFCSPCNTVVLNKAIGNREIVGYGKNSAYMYVDHPAWPFPAIRFREMTPELLSLREKEKGDWRKMTVEEKKRLYRASFCQTFTEILAPTGQWKSSIGFALIWISTGIWLFLAIRAMWHTELPDSYLEKNQRAQLKRMLTLEVNPVTGISSKWDYENKKWK